MSSRTINISEEVHDRQHEFLTADVKHRVIAAGRRAGKTTACAIEARDTLLEREGLVWWVAPTYQQAEIGFRTFLDIVPDELLSEENISRQKRTVELAGSRLEFKSADRPDNLRGAGIIELIIDEAPEVSRYAWENALRPTLSDTADSRMIAIGTPKGHNWFHDLFQKGQRDDYPAYRSWRFPTTANPFISHDDVRDAREMLPERVFRQEYLAEFTDDDGTVFQNWREDVVEAYEWRDYYGTDPFFTGVDFARTEDWTVIVTLDKYGKLNEFVRVNETGWPEIQRAVEAVYAEYGGQVWVDATRDNKIVSDLERAGVAVEPVQFTASRKRELVENLAVLLEKGELTLPADLGVLHSELDVFGFEATRAGNVRYGAREGFKDDAVDALALASIGLESTSGVHIVGGEWSL